MVARTGYHKMSFCSHLMKIYLHLWVKINKNTSVPICSHKTQMNYWVWQTLKHSRCYSFWHFQTGFFSQPRRLPLGFVTVLTLIVSIGNGNNTKHCWKQSTDYKLWYELQSRNPSAIIWWWSILCFWPSGVAIGISGLLIDIQPKTLSVVQLATSYARMSRKTQFCWYL